MVLGSGCSKGHSDMVPALKGCAESAILPFIFRIQIMSF